MYKVKKEKTIIIGCSGSGKDFLLRKLVEKGLKPCLKWTTRPRRKLEIQGIDYNYVEESRFLDNINNNNLLAYQVFEVFSDENSNKETWYYGITKEDFESSQVIIMTPGEFSNISEESRKNCFVVYLDISRDVRESRLNNRKDTNDSIKRRLDSDDIDFKDFNDYDLRITDPEFSSDDVYDLIN